MATTALAASDEPQLPTLGRIRLGDVHDDPKRPGKPLDHFRFTVRRADRNVIDAVVAAYGGTVKSITGQDGPEWSAVITAEKLDVAIPPFASSFDWNYELWQAGFCTRRCKGPNSEGCQCDPDPKLRECSLVSRLNVFVLGLPIAAAGVFRMDTGSWYFRREAEAVVLLSIRLAHEGLPVPATLAITPRTRRVLEDGKPLTKRFKVPVLRLNIPMSLDTLLGPGSGPAKQIAPPGLRALPGPEDVPSDETLDAEFAVREITDEDRFRAVVYGQASDAQRIELGTRLARIGLNPVTERVLVERTGWTVAELRAKRYGAVLDFFDGGRTD